MNIKALSIKQPYADQIREGTKTIEYRSWKTLHRGPLLICSGLQHVSELPEGKNMPKGCAICVVNVVDCVWNDDDDCFHWVLENPIELPNFPIKGKLGLFNLELSPDIEAILANPPQ